MQIKPNILNELWDGEPIKLKEVDVDDMEYIGANICLIDENQYGRRRWSVEYWHTYKVEKKDGTVELWGCNYSSPSTEQQDYGQDRWGVHSNGMVRMVAMVAVEKIAYVQLTEVVDNSVKNICNR